VPDPVNDALRKALADKLASHGFDIAAKFLPDRIDYAKALASWRNFPSCMTIYPTHIKRPPWQVK
jgi:hypothetical protein